MPVWCERRRIFLHDAFVINLEHRIANFLAVIAACELDRLGKDVHRIIGIGRARPMLDVLRRLELVAAHDRIKHHFLARLEVPHPGERLENDHAVGERACEFAERAGVAPCRDDLGRVVDSLHRTQNLVGLKIA